MARESVIAIKGWSHSRRPRRRGRIFHMQNLCKNTPAMRGRLLCDHPFNIKLLSRSNFKAYKVATLLLCSASSLEGNTVAQLRPFLLSTPVSRSSSARCVEHRLLHFYLSRRK